MPVLDVDRPPWKGLWFRDLIPATESSEESNSTDESMDALRTLEEHTTQLQVVSSLNPNRLVIKCKGPVPTRGNDNTAYFDLHSTQNLTLEHETTTLGQRGLKLKVPKGYKLLLFSQQKLTQEGYTIEAGDQRGETILIWNSTRRVKQIQHSERITHGLLVRAPEIEFVEVSQNEDLSETQRADQGLDSLGEI